MVLVKLGGSQNKQLSTIRLLNVGKGLIGRRERSRVGVKDRGVDIGRMHLYLYELLKNKP